MVIDVRRFGGLYCRARLGRIGFAIRTTVPFRVLGELASCVGARRSETQHHAMFPPLTMEPGKNFWGVLAG